MKFYTFAALACAASMVAACAPEKPAQIARVKAGTPTAVGLFVVATPQCDDKTPPEATLVTPPVSGKVTFTVQKMPFNNKESLCNGQMMTGRVVVYAPNAAFRGADKFTVRYVYDSNDGGGRSSREIEYSINVQ